MDFKFLIRLFILPVYKPVQGIYYLISNPKKLYYAIIIFLFLGIIYTISVQLAYSRGLGAAVDPFLKIPAEDYYYYQRYWQIIFFFITTILFAGIVRLLSEIVHGRGNFIDLFCLFCITQTFPMFVMLWIPETVLFVFFPGEVIKPAWLDAIRQIIGIAWPMVITVIGISKIETINLAFSVVFTVIAAIPVTTLMIIFIR